MYAINQLHECFVILHCESIRFSIGIVSLMWKNVVINHLTCQFYHKCKSYLIMWKICVNIRYLCCRPIGLHATFEITPIFLLSKWCIDSCHSPELSSWRVKCNTGLRQPQCGFDVKSFTFLHFRFTKKRWHKLDQLSPFENPD